MLLEQGRGLLLDQLMSPRARHDELISAAPDLATVLETTLASLNQPSIGDEDPLHRARLVEQFDSVSGAIRALDGFTDWGRPPPPAQLLAAASDGPVIVSMWPMPVAMP
jgi:hypothetical protein